MKKHEVAIIQGQDAHRAYYQETEANEVPLDNWRDNTTTYKFDSLAERDAFVKGFNEGIGWFEGIVFIDEELVELKKLITKNKFKE